jgi:recombinational DNA repair protein (RecF pathway)
MQEYVTRAIVLDKEPRNASDARYFLFTERYGKIAVRAKSSRKIVSKLAGHLEPGTIASVRVIEQHGSQVVDALKFARAGASITDLALLNNLLSEWQPDPELWAAVASSNIEEPFSWTNILTILGWDPRGAVCARCSANPAARPARHFFIPRQEFYCDRCASNFARSELLFIDVQ